MDSSPCGDVGGAAFVVSVKFDCVDDAATVVRDGSKRPQQQQQQQQQYQAAGGGVISVQRSQDRCVITVPKSAIRPVRVGDLPSSAAKLIRLETPLRTIRRSATVSAVVGDPDGGSGRRAQSLVAAGAKFSVIRHQQHQHQQQQQQQQQQQWEQPRRQQKRSRGPRAELPTANRQQDGEELQEKQQKLEKLEKLDPKEAQKEEEEAEVSAESTVLRPGGHQAPRRRRRRQPKRLAEAADSKAADSKAAVARDAGVGEKQLRRRRRREQQQQQQQRQHECGHCRRQFTNASGCRRHEIKCPQAPAGQLATSRDSRPFRCSLCDSALASRSDLKRHTLSHAGSFECPSCGHWFRELQELRQHVASSHDGDLPAADEADAGDEDDEEEESVEESAMVLADADDSGNKEGDGDGDGDQKQQEQQQEEEEDDDEEEEEEGDEESGGGSRLRAADGTVVCVDVVTEGGQRVRRQSLHRCGRCDRMFGSLRLLRQHAAEAHGRRLQQRQPRRQQQQKQQQQQRQQKQQQQRQQKQQQEQPEPTDKPCICALCQCAFAESQELAQHLKTGHNLPKAGGRDKQRRYQCYYCSKCFHQHTNLRRHLTCHTGQRQYQCPMCDKRFADRGDVNKHMVTHTGVRPYQCQVCGRRFGQRTNLRTHSLVHLRDSQKPFVCSFCGRRFAQKSALDRHSRSHYDVVQNLSDTAKGQRMEEDEIPVVAEVVLA